MTDNIVIPEPSVSSTSPGRTTPSIPFLVAGLPCSVTITKKDYLYIYELHIDGIPFNVYKDLMEFAPRYLDNKSVSKSGSSKSPSATRSAQCSIINSAGNISIKIDNSHNRSKSSPQILRSSALYAGTKDKSRTVVNMIPSMTALTRHQLPKIPYRAVQNLTPIASLNVGSVSSFRSQDEF